MSTYDGTQVDTARVIHASLSYECWMLKYLIVGNGLRL